MRNVAFILVLVSCAGLDLGDIVKVTPSSKAVGDMALFLITNNLSCADNNAKKVLTERPTWTMM